MNDNTSFATVMLITAASIFGAALSADRLIVAVIAFACSIIATRYLNVCIEEKVRNAR